MPIWKRSLGWAFTNLLTLNIRFYFWYSSFVIFLVSRNIWCDLWINPCSINTLLFHRTKSLIIRASFALILFEIEILRFLTWNTMISIEKWLIRRTAVFSIIFVRLSTTIVIGMRSDIWIEYVNRLRTLFALNVEFKIFIALLTSFIIITVIFMWH